MTGARPSGTRSRPTGQAELHRLDATRIDPARKFDMESISAWPEQRPPRAEAERSAIAGRFAAHLPNPPHPRVISEEDILAMRAAFIRRFDEQLPRTETLMAVARIGYRMALRDAAEAEDTSK